MQTSLGGNAGNLWQVFTCMVQMRNAVFGSAARCVRVGDPGLRVECVSCHRLISDLVGTN